MNTISIREDEFRPRDLPDGWDHSPEEDSRNWLTKQTEVAYYNFRANKDFQQEYFLKRMNRWGILPFRKNRDHLLGEILRKNPRMIGEPIYQQELDARAEQILKNYALGRLIVAGDNRFLSGDLLDFICLADGTEGYFVSCRHDLLPPSLDTHLILFFYHQMGAVRQGHNIWQLVRRRTDNCLQSHFP